MKNFLSMLVLLSTVSVWSATCDLEISDVRIDEINRQFDEGNIGGEDQLIQLTEARRDRSVIIEVCLNNSQLEGLSQEDLKQTKQDIRNNLEIALEEYRIEIELEISMDRIGMATEAMMERDMEKLRVANLISLIDSLIKKS